MVEDRGVSSLAIDLSRLHPRTLTSFYSNLVTRPTGRAIRMGVESQLADLDAAARMCLSVLDFSQVQVLDYSCADEIVAKLLLRFMAQDRPAEAYFLVRGLSEHHRHAVEAVLERHRLLLVGENGTGGAELIGPSNAFERACWAAVGSRGRSTVVGVATDTGMPLETVAPTVARLLAQRVAADLGGGTLCGITSLAGST
jgi:hypothetical protein